MKKHRLVTSLLCVSLAMLASLFGLGGCGTEGNTTNDTAALLYIESSFPSGAPGLNQAAELKCLLKTSVADTNNVKISIDLPDGLELVSGTLSAQFATISKGNVKEVKAIIKPTKVGDYAIEVRFSHGSQYTNSGLYNIYLYVTGESSNWFIFPIERSGTPPMRYPVKVKLSLPYAPAINQETDLTCTILSSTIDAPDTTVKITLSRRLTSEESLYMTHPYIISDNITRTLDLKAEQPVSFSTKIVFREAGKWKIRAFASAYVYHERHLVADYDAIYLTVSSDKGEFGWPPTPPVPVTPVAK